MTLVFLLLLILYCCYKKHYRNYRILNISFAIWAFFAVSILIFRPEINRSTNICSFEQKLLPIENDLDESEIFYLINDNNKIYYKTNKIHSIIITDSVIINYGYKLQPKVIKYYKRNSNLWYALTFNKKTKLVKIEFYIN